jgi:UDP-N-acetylmuramoyl-L-alanyl-D-glutamate--2,6-diaminopimelate ligase
MVIGITGTDGKTTTVGMTAHILHATGSRAGSLSTAQFRINDKIEWNATQKTSPSPFTVQKFLRRLVSERCTHAVIEYSSHGLVQGRTLFTWPQIAAITNTSAEHLDYHGSLEQYRADKALLFHMLGRKGWKILNAADETFEDYLRIPTDQTIAFFPGRPSRFPEGCHCLWLEDVREGERVSATVRHRDERGLETKHTLTLSIPGRFNLENALAAIGCALASGVPAERSIAALGSFPGIPGRMERIDEGQDFSVYVDFTVTPASYTRTLSTLKASLKPGGRLLVLTGSCGDRMREKRPQVGKIVSELADITVVANEDPYTEDPEKIIDEVWAGVDQTKTNAMKIVDRGEAIRYLLDHAKPGDIVLLCGKGSDTTMWVADGQIPWNEREIVQKMLKTL